MKALRFGWGYGRELKSRQDKNAAELHAAAAGGRDRGLRDDHPLAAHLHLAEALRRVYRLLDQGQGDVPAGDGRTHPVWPAHREHEVRLQGQEEADSASQGEVRLKTT